MKMNMNMKLRFLNWKAMLILLGIGWASISQAQNYIYFDLAAGEVTINASSYSGQIFTTTNGVTTTQTVSGTHSASNQYYVYQSQDTYPSATGSYRTTTGLVNGTMIIPSYDRVEDWANYTKDNTDVNGVIVEWRTRAAAAFRTATQKKIVVSCSNNMNVDLTIQDLWSNQQAGGATTVSGGLRVICSNTTSIRNAHVNLHYLGDNRFGNIYYLAGKGAGNQFVFDSPDATHSGTLTVANIQENANTNYWRAVIGADDSNGNSDGLVFNNGYVFAGATPQDNCTAIGAGGNDFGGITINGGTITAVASTTGTAIGGGIGWSSNGGDAYVHITDGEVYAYNFGISELSPNQYTSCVPVAAIGGGSSQSSSGNNSTEIVIEGGTVYAYSAAGAAIGGGSTSTQYGGKATITIGKSNGEGPTITAISTASTYYSYSAPAGVSIGGGTGGVGGSNTNGGNVTLNVLGGVINAYSREMENGQPGPLEFGHIGGGKTNGSGNGGSATIKVYDGTLTCGTIGGGDAITGNGGYASVIVTGGSIYEAAIGGGDSQSGKGGDAYIEVSGGLFDGGSIGGGDSESGVGGNAAIYITGGTLDCGSIGGGDSSTGTPGSVTANVNPNTNPLGAGIYIAGDNPIIVKSGYIGGGTNDAGDIGKATAYINTTHDDSSIQGQFILCNNTSTSTDHCFFVMEGGTIDNTDLEDLDGEEYPRAKEEGGAVYMEDQNGEVSISGNSIIRNATGTKGGAVYMTNGSFTLDGGVIHDNTAFEQGGAVYLGGGSFTLTSGAIGTEGHPNTADELGGGVYLSGSGAFNMSGGALSYNVGFAGGGGAYVNGGTVNITGGTVSYNSTDDDSGNGGGVFANGGSVSIESSTIEYNTAGTNGGGVYAGGGSVTLTSSTITNNTATNDDGGGVCAAGGTLVLDGGEVADNTAGTNGGGFFVNPGASNTTTIRNHAYIHDNSATNGGGAYVKSGQLVVKTAAGSKDDPTRINDNRASANGGGVYVENGDVTLTSVTMDGNEAGTSGGAMYTGGGSVTLTSSTVANNTATNGNGGGIYAIGAVTAEASSSITGNHADNGNGGGIYADAGENTVSVKGTSSITGNAAKNGAGIYAASGDIQVLTGSTMSGNMATADGGGIYANGGTVTVNPGNTSTVAMTDNHADSGNGGAIYANGGTVDFSNGTISANTASNGGAIYANGGLVDFSDGTIGNNYASARGGGLYITTNGTLELKGTATLTGNHVPSTGQGGGVYLAGVVKVGSEGGSSSNPKADAVIAEDNYADDVENPTITPDNRNNVYLPQPRVNGNAGSNDGHKDVITIYPYGMALQAGSKTAATHVGFSVPRNYVPVIFCTDDAYLGNNKPALEATVFDDSEQYLTIWNGSAPYDAHYIYLSGLLWTEAVDEEPATGFSIDGDGNVTVTNENGLAWLITYVNGRGGNHPMSPQDMEGKTVTIDMEGDLDMGRCGWVAIGTDGNEFKGTFNGNGHTISNIIATFGDDPGLFGTVSSGAQIKDVFVKGATLSCTKSDGGTYYMGTLASTLAGDAVVSGCGADGLMDCIENATGTVMGGLVGRMAAEGGQYPSIHSCFATPSMEGFTMGGIVGRMDGGSIVNSFTHPKFTYSGPYLVDPEDPATAQDYYIGGLVAEMNDGSMTNCYVYEQTDSDHGTGLFGWFAGKYTDGTFAYCYAPEDGNYIHPTSTGILGNTGYGWFAPTVLQSGKYGFKHQDQDVTAADGQDNGYIENGVIEAVTDGVVNNNGALKGLLATLNNWVKAQPSTDGYAGWTRTMASSINGDYPVLRYEGYDCVGSEDGASIVYKKDINDMLEDFLEGDIYLYRTPDVISKSTNADVRVYIEPNVGILQAAGNTLNARVGVTFDNSDGGWLGGKPYDWHMFASPLRNAPLGLVYHSQESGYEGVSDYTIGNNYNSGANYLANGIPESVYSDRVNMDPPKTTWNTEEGSVGYFPTDTPYGTWRNQPATSGSFDFYCYDESSRHWINFKREGREGFYDHWSDYVYNPETDNHTNIPYKNETILEPGKGYMMAVSEPTMLMADGVLNNGDANGTVKRTATYREGNGYDYSLRGVNLVGNPFQSYLDADLFLGENGLDTYYILDADKQGYIARVRGGSTPNHAEQEVVDYTAPQFVHPHQAFFVKVPSEQELRYTSAMRKTAGGSFRSEENHYPMVMMACSDEDGRNDFATIELDRPDQGGGEKVKGLHAGDASLWFSMEDAEWQVAFAPVGTTTASLRFQAYEDGVFALGWQTANADFNYLHLIDNLTGADIDCLKADEYRFEGRTTDYHSRFKLVFGYTGVDENEDGNPSADMASFAFQMGDGLVVNGEGVLQLFDVNGRLLMSTELYGTQNVVSIPKVSTGLYILRLTTDKQVSIQKMVINK